MGIEVMFCANPKCRCHILAPILVNILYVEVGFDGFFPKTQAVKHHQYQSRSDRLGKFFLCEICREAVETLKQLDSY